jgi:hypothetical protein
MPHYTLHMNVCIQDCVREVVALSDCRVDCMPHYTLHMNVCIQDCVREVVHPQYPGKK